MREFQEHYSESHSRQNNSLQIKLRDLSTYIVRRLKRSDLKAIYKILEKSFDEQTSKRAKLNYKQYFLFGHDEDRVELNIKKNWISVEYYVVETSGLVVGTFGLYAMSWAPSSYWLGWIAIDPEHRRKGLGTACLKIAERLASEKGARLFCLETSQLYDEAVQFYTAQSFTLRGKIDKYYGEQESLLIFSKKLPNAKRS